MMQLILDEQPPEQIRLLQCVSRAHLHEQGRSHSALLLDRRVAELLHRCGTGPWQNNKCFGKDPMIFKNWPLRPSLSRTNIKILISSCF